MQCGGRLGTGPIHPPPQARTWPRARLGRCRMLGHAARSAEQAPSKTLAQGVRRLRRTSTPSAMAKEPARYKCGFSSPLAHCDMRHTWRVASGEGGGRQQLVRARVDGAPACLLAAARPPTFSPLLVWSRSHGSQPWVVLSGMLPTPNVCE